MTQRRGNTFNPGSLSIWRTTLDGEVKGGFVHELDPVVGAIGEQMLDPGPALADGIRDRPRAGDVGWHQVAHRQATVRIDEDMLLAPDGLFGGVVPALRAHEQPSYNRHRILRHQYIKKEMPVPSATTLKQDR